MSKHPVAAVTEAVESEYAALRKAVLDGCCVDAGELFRVFSSQAQLLQSRGRHTQAIELVREATDHITRREGVDHEAALLMRELGATSQLKVGNATGALMELDDLYACWARLGNHDAMARLMFASLEHYRDTRQFKLAWQTFVHHCELFDLSSLSCTPDFVDTVLGVAMRLGKSDAAILLENWLAMVEDTHWEPDADLQALNQTWFDAYRTHVGGLTGLMGLRNLHKEQTW